MITPAFAQGTSAAGGVDMIIQLVPFILIFVIMWFLIIRPQQRRTKEHQELIKNIRRGDTVVTAGGIVGRVAKVVGRRRSRRRDRRRRAREGGPLHDLGGPDQGRAGESRLTQPFRQD